MVDSRVHHVNNSSANQVSSSRANQVFVIIDGNAILHRAYHALPPLTNSKGQQTNAVYGFVSMLFRIVDDLKPSHLAVCFDRPEPTFRKQMYVGYQAKRPKMDDELISQVDMVKKAVSSMNIPIFELAGFEADDLIGSLAFQAANRKSKIKNQKSKIKDAQRIDEIIIVTGDRDILQLVDKKIKVYMPIQGLTKAKLYGESEVEEKFGVKPPQIVDYKALAGDASDNYPGVRGIGPKTATELLQAFGTVEKLYEAIKSKNQKIKKSKEKIIQALSECAEDAIMAKKLAAIVTDAPVTLDIDQAALHDLNQPEARAVFQDLGFRTLLARLTGKKTEKKASEQLSLV